MFTPDIFYPIHVLRPWHERICLDRWKEINSHVVFSVVGDAFWCGTKKRNIQQIKWISICVVVISGLLLNVRAWNKANHLFVFSSLAVFVPLSCSLLVCHTICCKLSVFLSAYILHTLSTCITVSLHLSLLVSLRTDFFFFHSVFNASPLPFLHEGNVKTHRVGGLPAGGQLMRLCPCCTN